MKTENNAKSDLGMVIWLTGLSLTGKTTVYREIIDICENNSKKILWLDGDVIRSCLALKLGYTPQERKQVAYIYSNM